MSGEEYENTVKKYADMVFRIALNECKNREDAEDMVQNTFLKLLQHKKTFSSEEHRKHWLIRVTINECHSLFTSPWRQRTQSLDAVQYRATEEAAEENSEQSDLFYAVMDLPAKYRHVVYLYYYEEYSIREISTILKTKESTLQTRLMRARKILKEKMKGVWHDE